MSFVNSVSSVAVQSVMKTMKPTQNGVDITGDLTLDGVSFLLKAYPVGAVYVSTIQTNPSGLIGGTWERIEGKFLVGISDTDSTFADGATDIGEKEHTLTTAEMPQHTHSFSDFVRKRKNNKDAASGTGRYRVEDQMDADDFVTRNNITNTTGGGQSHNNLPPFLPVYIFKRTA
jgi:hypothetical protein